MLDSVRRVSLPDGPLRELGAGDVMISAKDAKSLVRWRIGLAVPSTFALILGTSGFFGNVGKFFLGSGWWRAELSPTDVAVLELEYAEQAKVYSKFL